jgi:hypothetical protein
MTIAQILAELDDTDGLPREALRAASEHRGELVPRFIEAFDSYTPDAGDESMLFFAFHLLGQWRETSAYRPLCRFLRRMGGGIHEILGEDTVTETSHRVMAAVFDGDPAPLYEVIYDPGADEYVRSCMITALSMLTARGALSRGEMERFLREAFDRLKPRRGCIVWTGWEEAVVELGMVELKPLLEAAFRRGSIDPTWSTLADSETALAKAQAGGCAAMAGDNRSYALFGDVIEEFATWHSFSEAGERERAQAKQEAALAALKPVPASDQQVDWRDRFANVPLKAPCPCGSGRKFKHCHGR